MTPYSNIWLKEALRVFTRLTTIKPLLQIILLILKRTHQFKKNVRLGGRFHTPVLDYTIKLPI